MYRIFIIVFFFFSFSVSCNSMMFQFPSLLSFVFLRSISRCLSFSDNLIIVIIINVVIVFFTFIIVTFDDRSIDRWMDDEKDDAKFAYSITIFVYTGGGIDVNELLHFCKSKSLNDSWSSHLVCRVLSFVFAVSASEKKKRKSFYHHLFLTGLAMDRNCTRRDDPARHHRSVENSYIFGRSLTFCRTSKKGWYLYPWWAFSWTSPLQTVPVEVVLVRRKLKSLWRLEPWLLPFCATIWIDTNRKK